MLSTSGKSDLQTCINIIIVIIRLLITYHNHLSVGLLALTTSSGNNNNNNVRTANLTKYQVQQLLRNNPIRKRFRVLASSENSKLLA